MSLDLSDVEFSKNDIRLGIKIPTKMSSLLAYETGIHIGDGYLGIFRDREGSTNYKIQYTGDYSKEREFHEIVIKSMIISLYNKNPRVFEARKNTINTTFKSKAVATFKHYVLELPNGNKKGKLRIPKIIMESSIDIKMACVSGFIDTDFCFRFIRGGVYPRITASFPIENAKLVEDFKNVVEEANIKPTICIANVKDNRYNPIKIYKDWRIDINGKENLNKLLKYKFIKNIRNLNKLKQYASVAQLVER